MFIRAAVIRARKTTRQNFSLIIAAGTSEFVFYYPDCSVAKPERALIFACHWIRSDCWCCFITNYVQCVSTMPLMLRIEIIWRVDSINWQIGKCQALYFGFRFPSIYYQIELFLDDFLLLAFALNDTRPFRSVCSFVSSTHIELSCIRMILSMNSLEIPWFNFSLSLS